MDSKTAMRWKEEMLVLDEFVEAFISDERNWTDDEVGNVCLKIDFHGDEIRVTLEPNHYRVSARKDDERSTFYPGCDSLLAVACYIGRAQEFLIGYNRERS
jgi:hypothetical protein